ncbi:MAG TPA: hypothetical protein PLH19_11410 [Anaerolineae bacterium]|nr:hypothetical protein [Anaerolineae bacterium]HQH39128.1 hypothetical protein [Anaerolineae bacterium]
MSQDNRKNLIRNIEQKRGSKVITYVTSDRDGLSVNIAGDVVSILHEHILAIEPREREKLDLFIYSRGGDSDVPWSIVSMFREYCKEGSFSVLIPYRAHSAATVISLGADEIVMTRKAELGPIDITIQSGPYNPTEKDSIQRLPVSVEDVNGYFSLLEKIGCTRPEETMKGFEQLTQQVHPLVLGTVSRLFQQTELVALRLLGTRANPFPEEKNREILRRLSSEIFSHRHTISRTEATRQLGLTQVVNSEDAGIDTELWELYKEYRELFLLEEPFRPEEYLVSNNLDEYTYNALNLACIESATRFDICQKDVKARRIRQVPPQLTLNLGNLHLPTVNIPTLPPGIAPQDIARIVEQLVPPVVKSILTQASEEAARQFLSSLPTAGFELVDFNARWKTE